MCTWGRRLWCSFIQRSGYATPAPRNETSCSGSVQLAALMTSADVSCVDVDIARELLRFKGLSAPSGERTGTAFTFKRGTAKSSSTSPNFGRRLHAHPQPRRQRQPVFHNTTLRRKAAVDFCTTTSCSARQRSSCAQIQARPRTIALHSHLMLMVYARQALNRKHSDDTQQVLWPSCCVSLKLRIKRAHDATSPWLCEGRSDIGLDDSDTAGPLVA